MRALRQALDSEGWQYLGGSARTRGQWPAEDSVLIWGMDADTARQWGRHWQQNAVLWSDADARPGCCGCADFLIAPCALQQSKTIESYLNSIQGKRLQLSKTKAFGNAFCVMTRWNDQRGSSLAPIRNSSTARAAWRPSRMAHTTSDWPRRMSPAANTLGTLVA
jgi:hypothetical protein